MKFIQCQKWFLFENGSHEYKTTDGVIFYFNNRDSWCKIHNEHLLEDLRSCYNKKCNRIKGEINMKKLKKVVNVLSICAVSYVGYLAMNALWKVDVLLALATGCLYVLEVLRNVSELMRDE